MFSKVLLHSTSSKCVGSILQQNKKQLMNAKQLSVVCGGSSYDERNIQKLRRHRSNGDVKRRMSTVPKPSQEIILTSPLGSDVDIPDVPLTEYLFKDINNYLEKPALTCGMTGRGYNFGMTQLLTRRMACALLERLQLKPGDVIGLLLPNIPEYAITIQGALQAGLIVTFVNPLYTPDEIKRQFENAETKAIITVQMLLDAAKVVASSLPGYRGTILVGGDDNPFQNIYGLQSLLTQDYDVELPKVNPNSTAILPYSSGTTGLPKGVQLTHRNLVANLVQGDHERLRDCDLTTETHQDSILTVLPFFHIYGFNGILNLSLALGLHTVTLPKFTPEDYIKALVTYKPRDLFVVPSLLLFLASHPAVTKEHLSSVKAVMSGGAPATQNLIEMFKNKIGRDDVLIRQGYGMTETSPVTLIMPNDTPASKVGTCGILARATEAKIVHIDTGETLGPHKSGELYVRGPQVMPGYWKNEEATRETIDSEGWLHTGDIAYYDEDEYFYIVDRTKELIKVKGNQVSPTELENLILEMIGVADVAVVPVPDALAGEVPRAFVVLKPDAKITEKDVIDFVKPKVVKYKQLKGGVRFIKAIPRNAAGKIIRNELKVLGEDSNN